jgi:hypothetical protein
MLEDIASNDKHALEVDRHLVYLGNWEEGLRVYLSQLLYKQVKHSTSIDKLKDLLSHMMIFENLTHTHINPLGKLALP